MEKFVALCGVLMFVSSCSSINKVNTQYPPVQASIISVKHNSIPVAANATFRWQPEHIRFYHDPRLRHANLDAIIQSSIEQSLISKGYVFEAQSDHTDFLIAYAAALESALDNDEIQQKFGLQPGMVNRQKNSDHVEKGTVIVDIIDTRSGRLIWRSAGQAMATIKDMPANIRRERVDMFINQLLSDLPAAIQ